MTDQITQSALDLVAETAERSERMNQKATARQLREAHGHLNLMLNRPAPKPIEVTKPPVPEKFPVLGVAIATFLIAQVLWAYLTKPLTTIAPIAVLTGVTGLAVGCVLVGVVRWWTTKPKHD